MRRGRYIAFREGVISQLLLSSRLRSHRWRSGCLLPSILSPARQTLTHAFWHTDFQDDRGVVGRLVQLNKHPFTILGVAPPEFRGTLTFLFPDFWVPLVNQEQVEGANVLNDRSNRGILMVLGHLKAGVTPAQAISDLNSVGAYLEKSYPKDDGNMTYLGRFSTPPMSTAPTALPISWKPGMD